MKYPGARLALAITVLSSACGLDPGVEVGQVSREGVLGTIGDKACAYLAVNAFDDEVLAQIESVDLEEAAVCDGSRVPPTYGSTSVECRFWCDQCQTNILDDLADATDRIELVDQAFELLGGFTNLGGQGNNSVSGLARDMLIKAWGVMVEWCVGVKMNENPGLGAVGARGECSTVAGMQSFLGQMANLVAAGVSAGDCFMQTYRLINDLTTVVAQQAGLGRDYDYLNYATSEAILRPVCQGAQVFDSCVGAADAINQILPNGSDVLGQIASAKDLLSGSLSALGLACEFANNCNRAAVCQAAEIGCQFQTIAMSPADRYTAATNYAGDAYCCCSQAGPQNNFSGPWTVIEEHRCINSGWSYRPGTCGSGDPAQRAAQGRPGTPEECRAYNAAAGSGDVPPFEPGDGPLPDHEEDPFEAP